MELGLTFPLQRFLKRKPPVGVLGADRRFCWDLHKIQLRGRPCLLAAGFASGQIQGYLARAGSLSFTRTHGRREVAFLNRAWEDVMELDLCLDTADQLQPLLEQAVNSRPCRCAGSEGLGTGLTRMAALLAET